MNKNTIIPICLFGFPFLLGFAFQASVNSQFGTAPQSMGRRFSIGLESHCSCDKEYEEQVFVVLEHEISSIIDNVDGLFFGFDSEDYEVEDLSKGSLARLRDRTKEYEKADLFKRIIRISKRKKEVGEELFRLLDKNSSIDFYERANFHSGQGRLHDAPNDPYFPTSSSLTPPYQNYLLKSNFPGAWSVTHGSSSVVVGLIDTGVYTSHEDLSSTKFPSSLAYDAGNQGRSAFAPVHPHGTMTGGILAASTNNSTGVAGACWEGTIATIRADEPSDPDHQESLATILRSLDQACAWSLPICNWSGGFDTEFLSLKQAILNYDGLLIVASGNDSANLDSQNTQGYPSSWKLDNVISVNGLTSSSTTIAAASFSNYGSLSTHIFAQASGVTTTNYTAVNAYTSAPGTSMAAPQVAGAAALVLAANPSFSAGEIKWTILDNATTSSALSGLCTTGGYLNAAAIEFNGFGVFQDAKNLESR